MSTAATPLSAQSPWPGLASFSEADQEFFRGRAREADDLARLVRRERLSVLFGRSGLGKSSLLAAGLAPRLREDLHLPVLLRIDYRAGLAPRQQVWQALAAELARWHVSAEPPRDDDTLWSYFHRAGAGFWNQRNRPLLPVLVFDQFEELFTQGQADAAAREHASAFVAELADLVEDRMPLALQQALEHDPQRAEAYDSGRRGCKIVLSFREDFLAQVEGLHAQMPSVMRNRFRLPPMDLAQARAVVGSGGDLVGAEVAPRLLGLAWNNKPEPPPDDGRPLEFDPALLSVICAELNRLRLVAGEAQIELSRLETSGAGILGNFYDRTIAGVGPALKQFVEDELVTPTGVRDSRALDDALARPGVSADEVRHLVDGRLLRMDDRFGVQRLELTHDVLTGVIAERRRTRRAQEAEAAAQAREQAVLQTQRRARRTFAGAVLAVAAAVGLLAWAGIATLSARDALRDAEVANRGAAAASANAAAMAASADFLRQGSEAAQAAARGAAQAAASAAADASAATGRANALLREAIATDLIVNAREGSESSADRSLLLGAVAVARFPDRLDARLQQLARLLAADSKHTLLRVNAAVETSALSPDHRLLALGTADGQVVLIDITTWRELRRWDAHPGQSVQRLAFSSDARRLVSADVEYLAAWSVDSGESLGRTLWAGLGRGLRLLVFAPDATQVVVTTVQGGLGRWTLDGSNAGRLASLETVAACLGFDADGTLQYGRATGSGRWTVDGAHRSDPRPVMPFAVLARSSDCKTEVVLRPAAAGAPQQLYLIRPGDGAPLGALGERPPGSGRPGVYYAGKANQYVALQDQWTLTVWSTDPVRQLARIGLPDEAAADLVDVSPDGRWVAVVQDRRLEVHSTGGLGRVLDLHLPEAPRAVAFSADGGYVMPVGLRGDGRGSLLSVYRLDPRPDALRGTDGRDTWEGIEFNRSGSMLVLVTASDFHVWDVAQVRIIDTVKNLRLGEFSPDGNHLVVLRNDGSYEVRSLVGSPRGVFSRPAAEVANANRMSVALGREGRLLAVLMTDKSVHVYDVAANRMLHRLDAEAGRTQVAISPDLQTLATAGVDGRVVLHRLGAAGGRPGPLATAHKRTVRRLMFSPDGRWIASGGDDQTVLLHDVRSGTQVARLDEPHYESVDWLVFVEDGKVLVTGAEKGVRHLWDTRSWQWLGKLGGAGSGVGAVDLSPTAGRSAVRSHGNQVTLRRWDRDTLLRDSCALAGRNLSCAEWRQYVPGLPYAKLCPALPPPADAPCRP